MSIEELDFDFEGENRIVSPVLTQGEDSEAELSLRPKFLREYIGQDKVKENLKVFIDAAKARHESLDHLILYGPPGLGKTTLAHIIANELGVGIKVTSGPVIEKKADLASLLTNLSEGDVLFIDEIHRMPRPIEEILYSAMEDFVVDILIGQGPSARSIRIDIPHFTLIGATTRLGQISQPLRDRFGISMRLDLYKPEQLSTIVKRSAEILGIEIDPNGADEIARRSRGTPRIANRLLKRTRDFAQSLFDGRITKEAASYALKQLEIDEIGLDQVDRKMMETIIHFYHGGPVGLEALAATIGEEAVTLEDVYEPYLLQIGYICRTKSGRCVTSQGYEHLGIPYPGTKQFSIEDTIRPQ